MSKRMNERIKKLATEVGINVEYLNNTKQWELIEALAERIVDDCIEGTLRLFNSNHSEPTNIGSDEQVSINQMADIIEKISGVKNLKRKYLLDKPKGVRGRSSDNTNAIKALNWKYTVSLNEGLKKTYSWILSELKNDRSNTNKFCRS